MRTTPWLGKDNVVSEENRPAVYVSWNDAQLFIERLNMVMGKKTYRLPTEAEWEYACRAGTNTLWSWGKNESSLGKYAVCGSTAAGAVGTKKPNQWGLYDMHGNVREWCHDWFGIYPNGVQVDPTGPATGSNRVVRGGGFYSSARTVRSALRGFASSDGCYPDVGFRLLRTL